MLLADFLIPEDVDNVEKLEIIDTALTGRFPGTRSP